MSTPPDQSRTSSVNDKIQHFETLQSHAQQEHDQETHEGQQREDNRKQQQQLLQRQKSNITVPPTVGRNVDTNRLLKRLDSGRGTDLNNNNNSVNHEEKEEIERTEEEQTAASSSATSSVARPSTSNIKNIHRTTSNVHQESESSPLGVFSSSAPAPAAATKTTASTTPSASSRPKPTLGIATTSNSNATSSSRTRTNTSSPSQQQSTTSPTRSRVNLLNHQTPSSAKKSYSAIGGASSGFFKNKRIEEQFRALTADASPPGTQEKKETSAPRAGVSSSTFLEGRVTDPDSNKVLLLSSVTGSSPATMAGEKSPATFHHHHSSTNNNNNRRMSSSANKKLSMSPEPNQHLRNNNNGENPISKNFIPRWATPSPGSSQVRMPEGGGGDEKNENGGGDRIFVGGAGMPSQAAASQLHHAQQTPLSKMMSQNRSSILGPSSPYYYSPADQENQTRQNNNNNTVPSFPQHLFGEDPDPCPPEMMMEMLLHSTVFVENEIKMKRQIALWECYERKMATGSFVDAPFAVEHAS